MKRITLGCFFFIILNNALAQEQRVFSQFFMNPYVYNPAYVGVEGHSALFAMYRQQYVSLPGGPQFSHVTFHTPLENGLGVGGMVFNEEEGGILRTTGFKASASYLAAFDRKHYLRFGMSIGAGQSALDNSDPAIAADIFGDPAFVNLTNNYLIADFGMTYHFDHFNVGISFPNLVSREVISAESFSPIKISPTDNILLKMNYRGHISHDFAIEPHILYRYSGISTNQLEAAVIMHLKHIVWVGGSYRQGAGINALVGFKVKEKFGIGYAFELGNADISSVTGNTHELHIGYHLSEHKKHHGHHHSFIKSHKLTAEERAKLAEEKRLKQEEKERREQERLAKLNEQREEKEPTTTENESSREEEPGVADERTQPESNDRRTSGQVTDNREQPTSNDTQKTEPDRQNNTTERTNNTSNISTPSSSTGEVVTSPSGAPRVKRGNHFLELPPGNHVIAGAFSEFQHAEDYSDVLFQRGFHDTIVGYQSEKGYYYVVLYRSAAHAEAAKQRSRIRQMEGLGDVWILTVE